MFGKKKNKEGFKLNINKEQAEKEYEEYLNQPPEVLENLKMCKIFMAIFIPVGILVNIVFWELPFNSIVINLMSVGSCLLVGTILFFTNKNFLTNWKLRLVPLICLCVGWVIGMFCIQSIILIILKVAK